MSSDKIKHCSLKVTPPDITVNVLRHIAAVGGAMNFPDLAHLGTTENAIINCSFKFKEIGCNFITPMIQT